MPNLDIQISGDLKQALDLAPCDVVSIPEPQKLKIQLPTGASIKAIADVSKGIPTDCAMTFSLMVQLAPFLASMECLIKILKLLKPLVDVVTNLPMPPVKAVQDFAKAAVDLAPCFLIPTPANIIPFIKDVLCLILKVLKCLESQLQTVVALMKGLTLDLNAARLAGNRDLQETLECAKKNAETSAQHLTSSMEPIGVILDFVGPFLGMAGVKPIQLPGLGSDTDVETLETSLQAIHGLIGTLQIAVDALGGCE